MNPAKNFNRQRGKRTVAEVFSVGDKTVCSSGTPPSGAGFLRLICLAIYLLAEDSSLEPRLATEAQKGGFHKL